MGDRGERKNYYAVLGAEESATREEIDRLYKRKAVQCHPDRGGNEEEMKSLNEAYRVLKDDVARRTYDGEQQDSPDDEVLQAQEHPLPTSSPGAKLDAITHQVGASLLFIVLGLVLLFVVRFQYVIFLWPLALLAVAMILFGIVQAHSALNAVRRNIMLAHPALRLVLVQETLFWSAVFGGGYGVYLLLTAS
jgi:hypothetical protein